MNRHPDSDTYFQAGEWLVGTARRNPEALLLLAAGCALLMRRGSRDAARSQAPTRAREGDRGYAPASDASSVGQGLSRTAEKAADYASDIKDKVSDTASSYADSVSEFAADARRNFSEGSERLRRQAQSTFDTSMDRVLRDQPLAIAVAGLAAGAAIAAVFPATDMENRALGGAHEALTGAVDQAGKSVMGAASKAGEHLKAAAEEKGLTAQGLKDLAGDVADTFTNAVAGKDHKEATTVPSAPRSAEITGAVAGQPNSNVGRAPNTRPNPGPTGGSIR